MRVSYTTHARLRMRQRGVTVHAIEAVLRTPDRVRASFSGRRITQRQFRGRTLEVVYRPWRDRVVILTAYWVGKGD